MRQMTLSLKLYLAGVSLAGMIAIAAALWVQPPPVTSKTVTLGVLIGVLTGLTYLAPVKLGNKRTFVPYTALQVVAVLTLSPGEAALWCLLGVAAGNLWMRRAPLNVLFNAAQNGGSVLLAAAVYRALAPVSLAQPGHDVRSALALIPAGALLYLVSALAVDCAAAIQRRRSPFADWWSARHPTFLPHAMLVIVGAATAPAAELAPWLLCVAVAPVVVVRATLRHAIAFDASAVRAVEVISDALDGDRARRRADLAWRLSEARHATEEQRTRTVLAARLFDLRVAAPAGAYSGDAPEEIARSLRLPIIADILSACTFRYDGHDGGPRGNNLPLESRIVSICGAWVALTSPSPDRPAWSADQALAVLRAGAGRRWAPDLVELFAQMLRADATGVASQAAGPQAVTTRPVTV